ADIGYRLAPRLNAAGRLGCARLVVELLTTTSPERAADLARYLEEQNQKRQTMERRILSEARALASAGDLAAAPPLVLARRGGHPGIIGIVPGRLADLYGRPVLMIALRKERGEGPGPDGDGAPVVGQGSGRSVPGFPLHEALRACEEHLLSHGGHAAAAGFKIHPDRIDALPERVCAYASRHFPPAPPAPPPGHRRRGAAQRPHLRPARRPRPAGDVRGGQRPAAVPGRRPGGPRHAAAHRPGRAAHELPRPPARDGHARHRLRHGRPAGGTALRGRPLLPRLHPAPQRVAGLPPP